jgi:PcfJ-like protein
MGKQIKLREAQRREAEHAIAARLRTHSGTRTGPAFIGRYCEFAPDYRSRIEAYRDLALRQPEAWRCQLRLRSPALRFLELVQFTFAKYPVAHHLENAWIAEAPALADGFAAPGDGEEGGDAIPDFRRWYIAVAQGRLLYKEAAHRYLTRLETHHFVNAPREVGSTRSAFCYAYARAQTADTAAALRIARTRLAGLPVVSPFWQGVARFFAQNPTSIQEMNELIDFFAAAKREDDGFSLKGRSLSALRRRLAEWHRLQREIERGEAWAGRKLADVKYETGNGAERAVWRFRQIKTGRELALEGRRMRHCIAVYQGCCVAGEASIWSLTCEYPDGSRNNGVTIELRGDGTIVQCRGFANRAPNAEEAEMVRRWAAAQGLRW